jgi:excinuclease ABC subunit A
MGGSDVIRIRGARQHNLKNVDLELPRNQLIVFTGVSGSGKSSLAFDTIFAEGQRRYVESLSAYARQFLGQLDKPDVDAIEGLSPAISIDQKSTSHNPRSTVGTVTEIYDYFRLLFGRVGVPHCPICDRNISPQTVDQIADQILSFPQGTRFLLLAPVVKGKKGTHQKLLAQMAQNGFARVRVNGTVYPLTDVPQLDKNHSHRIEIVVDRLVIKPDLYSRLVDSLTTCLHQGEGVVIVSVQEGEQWRDLVFSERFACPEHGAVMSELSPRLFSFNSPYGACPECHGLGFLRQFSLELVIPNPKLPLYQAIAPWAEKPHDYYLELLHSLGSVYGFELSTPWCDLTPEQQHVILYGAAEPIWVEATGRYGSGRGFWKAYEGVFGILERQYRETTSELVQQKLDQYRFNAPCPACQGARLKPEALAVRVGGYRITDFTQVSVQECLHLLDRLELTPRQAQIAHLVLKEIRARLQFLVDVGLDYLTLDRAAMTLSGGEAQRIRLATQIGSGLTGVLYVLDEPSIGLHQRDNGRLLATLKRLRDLGNTLIVVEHDEETITQADHLVDIGPGAGIHGGRIVAQGNVQTIMNHPDSITGAYLSRRKEIPTPARRRPGNGKKIQLKDAHRHNLQHIDVDIPLGMFVCVTGVSGSGKSTLINELLYPALAHHLGHKIPFPSELQAINGLEALDKVIVVDQSPIGRTPPLQSGYVHRCF